MKKAVKIISYVIFILLIMAYPSIVITNNYLANKVEKDLVEYQLPQSTELVDSISIAGKLSGNGNGMQYMGSILVTSDLSAEELKNYYSNDFEHIEVREQKSENIDFINSRNYRYEAVLQTQGNTYYSVICWDLDRSEFFSDFIITLLDFDIRGH